MGELGKVLFQLKENVVISIGSAQELNVHKKMNKEQLNHFQTTLTNINSQLDTYTILLLKVENNGDFRTEIAKLLKEQCIDGLHSLKKTLQNIESTNNAPMSQVYPTKMQKWMKQFIKQLTELNECVEELRLVIVEMHEVKQKLINPPENQPDIFEVVNMVPANPPHIALNFKDSKTIEAQLKKAIFEKKSNGTVTAMAAGMSGVGKTCALRGVGLEKDTTSRFPDGILYMTLGAESGKAQLIQNIADFVGRSGGYKKSEQVRYENNLVKCINLAAQWFQGRICLFLVDDVWCKNGIDSSVTKVLSGLSVGNESRIAFTTRDVTLESDQWIHFRARSQLDSEKILLHTSGLPFVLENSKDYWAVKSVIDMTHGLPIALNVIGKRARYLMQMRRVNANNVWTFVQKDYQEAEHLLSSVAFRDNMDGTVLNILFLSLTMIESHSKERNYRDLFSRFCILRKRQQIPFDVLERIWGMSPIETKSQIEVFERFSMVEISHSFADDSRQCFGIHDLLLDMSRHLAAMDTDFMKLTSQRVLYSYVSDKHLSQYGSETAQASFSSSLPKRKFDIKNMLKIKKKENLNKAISTVAEQRHEEHIATIFKESWIRQGDDGFALRNLFRLLRNAELYLEGVSLLTDPRWIAKQIRTCGWKQADQDFEEMLTQFEETEGKTDADEVYMFLSMLRAAVSESERHVVASREPGMLPTQLYGRLYHYRSFDLVQKFLVHLEESTTGSWMKSSCAFPAPVASSGKVLDISGGCIVRYTEPCVEIVIYDKLERLFELRQYYTADDVLTEALKKWRIPTHVSDGDFLCSKVGLSQDCKTFVAAAGSKLVVFALASYGEGDNISNADILSINDYSITSLDISTDGCSVVTGNEGGNVVLWEKTYDDWEPKVIGSHRMKVRSVAIAKSGNFVISGSEDKSANIWNREGFAWGSTVLPHEEQVTCCAISTSETCMITASDDQKVRVWYEEQCGWKPLELNVEWGSVGTIAISEDNCLVVCGTWTNVVVFKQKGVEWTRTVLKGHSNPIKSVDIRVGNGEIVSTSVNGTVRVSDVRAAHWEISTFTRYSIPVACVAVSACRVVCGYYLGTVIVWDLCNKEWKSNPCPVDRDPIRINLEEGTSPLRMKITSEGIESDNVDYYIEENGKWLVDKSTDFSNVEWASSAPLKKEKWPLGLTTMRSDWYYVYAVPGDEWYAVVTRHYHRFEIIRLMNSP